MSSRAKVPNRDAACMIERVIFLRLSFSGFASRSIGICNWQEFGRLRFSKSLIQGNLLPRSTEVAMYSLPWIPSRVGRTISDISVQMSSKPEPLNGPRYPAPKTGIFPSSASLQIVWIV